MIVCSSSIKPLMLVHLLQQHQLTHGICFTKSTEAATRLVKLLQFLHEEMPDAKRFKAASFSSELSVPERSKVINQFKLGEISLFVHRSLMELSRIDA